MIKIWIREPTGKYEPIEIPTDMGLSLMEIFRAAGYFIPATCGGIALCATCLVKIISGSKRLPAPGDAELEMLDTLPLPPGNYRLSCQIRIVEEMDGCIFELPV